ncbi:MAG: tetratricopeptide repeat protein [Alphaproteobacteria bacterium]|nr:tetratricopeptide repeat protein [Alphaproteobacteria bacterium]
MLEWPFSLAGSWLSTDLTGAIAQWVREAVAGIEWLNWAAPHLAAAPDWALAIPAPLLGFTVLAWSIGRTMISTEEVVDSSRTGASMLTGGAIKSTPKAANIAYEDSVARAEALVHLDPYSVPQQRHLSLACEELGDHLRDAGDWAGAMASYGRCLEIRERLAQDNPSSAEAWSDLSITLGRIGNLLSASGDSAGAKARFEQGLAILERMERDNVASVSALRGLSIAHGRIGAVAEASGDLDGAEAAYASSLAIAERLAADNPSSPVLAEDADIARRLLFDLRAKRG